MTQPDLLGFKRQPTFDGPFLEPDDHVRLTGLMERVAEFMADHQWHTLAEIAAACQPCTETSVSARLRDFRKPAWGSHNVERQRIAGGLFAYRIAPEGV